VRSVRTTFQILEAVADNQPIGLSELARRLDLPKSTVQRSLATLADLGWIRPDGRELTRWTLGERVRALSDKVDDLGRLRDAALPVLAQLNSETLETIHLAVLEERTVRLIERLDSKHPLRLVQVIGSRSPLHASSTGKSVLAHLPEAEIDAYIDGGLMPVTASTITDPDRLRAELKAVRERGYAIADEEYTEGTTSVAACIRSAPGGRPIAAMSVSGPSIRMREHRHTYGQRVAIAAAEVESNLHGASR
jgi:IclR family transcriptional regulator, acetate operon repressor